MVDPIVHLVWTLAVLAVIGGASLPVRAYVASAAGLLFLALYAPLAAAILIFVWAQAAVLFVVLRRRERGDNWRKYAPYALLLNLFFVDFSSILLKFDVILIGVSFSIVRIFIAIKQFLSSRRKLSHEYYAWSAVALFYLPTLFVGPVFSAYTLWEASRLGPAPRKPLAREFRVMASGLILAVIASPFFTKVGERLPGFVDPVFRSTPEVVVALAGAGTSAVQIVTMFLALFAAFWGQSLIAETTSRLLGFSVPQNFDRPWLATDIRDFWNRWHISMAEFVRNYIFIPLNLAGVNPRLAIFVAFIFMGLWHRVSPGYLLWGIGHGLLLALWPERPEQASKARIWFERILTLVLVIALSYVGNHAFS
jgi:D-alanyl-lipoteichoic acid acyltransferase DltB (MBOAT superfamily)